jgi:hypothetical protein
MCPSERGRSAPTDDELAAIVAAVELAWPRPVVVPEPARPTSAWRFSGRWWVGDRPVAADRRRP